MSPSRGQRREGRFSEPLPDRVSKAGLSPPGGAGWPEGRRGSLGLTRTGEKAGASWGWRLRRQATGFSAPVRGYDQRILPVLGERLLAAA